MKTFPALKHARLIHVEIFNPWLHVEMHCHSWQGALVDPQELTMLLLFSLEDLRELVILRGYIRVDTFNKHGGQLQSLIDCSK